MSVERYTDDRVRGASRELVVCAQELRANMTHAEWALWDALKGKRLAGLRFRRQHPIGLFILDFYCPVCKLAVEVDGSVHDAQTERDAERTELLACYGIRVTRFRNEEVIHHLPSVLAQIKQTASNLLSDPPRIGG